MLTFILCLAFGAALACVIPTNVSGQKHTPPAEADFQELLSRRGVTLK